MSGGRHTSSLQFPVCVWFGPRRQADADRVKYTFRRLCCRQFLCRPHPWFGGLVVGFSFPDTVCACCVIFAKSQWYLNSYKVLCVCVCLCVTSQCMLAFASSLVNPPPFSFMCRLQESACLFDTITFKVMHSIIFYFHKHKSSLNFFEHIHSFEHSWIWCQGYLLMLLFQWHSLHP